MKVLQSSFFRALCAIIIGALLIQYRDEASKWFVIVIGTLFFLSGVISCAVYYASRRQQNNIQVFDANGMQISGTAPAFPIVGIGSVIFGAILALMPDTFITWLNYVLATILILGSINQFVALASVHKIARIGIFFWVVPCLTLLVGIVAIIRPNTLSNSILFIIGWSMLVYGIVEAVNSLKIYSVKKTYEAALQAQEADKQIEEQDTPQS